MVTRKTGGLGTLLTYTLFLAAALILSGCASFLNKGNNAVVLESVPSGAVVYINGNQKGMTPYTYAYIPEDGTEVMIEFRLTGYKPTRTSMRASTNKGVLFADAMLLGIPYLVDKKSPYLYQLPTKQYLAHLYKETPELTHYSIPLSKVALKLGDKPDLGKFRQQTITLKDDIFRELNYGDPLSNAIVSGLKGSWIDSRMVRLNTTKGDETIRKSKIHLVPEIHSIKADLHGNTQNCTGTVDMAIVWKFMSGTITDSLLFSLNTVTKYQVNGSRTYDILTDAMIHAARSMAEDESLHAKVAAAYGAELALSKGQVVSLMAPVPIQFGGRKDMLSALVKAVVTIETEDGHGSGFLISNDGYLITNEHVVSGEKRVKVKFEQGFTLEGLVVKTNLDFDLALVKVEATDLPALSIGNDEGLMLGEEIFAIGTPLDASLGQSVSRGILSGRREFNEMQFLQTDVSINPGNSGGPLIDDTGSVVGVATMKIAGKGLEGLGFGVPISIVLRELNINLR